eukprot:4303619-Prymnesium_polylepis.1
MKDEPRSIPNTYPAAPPSTRSPSTSSSSGSSARFISRKRCACRPSKPPKPPKPPCSRVGLARNGCCGAA